MNTHHNRVNHLLAMAFFLGVITSGAFASEHASVPTVEVEVRDSGIILHGAPLIGIVHIDVRNETSDTVVVEFTLHANVVSVTVALEFGETASVVLGVMDGMSSIVAALADGTVLHTLEGADLETSEVGASIDIDTLMAAGRTVYQNECVNCHGSSGEGDVGVPLANNAFLEDTRFVVTQTVYGGGFMPGFQHLSDEDVAAVATYIRSAWGNDFGAVTIGDVEQHR